MNKPQSLSNWKSEIPALVFISGKIAKTNGNEKIYLPAYTIKKANKIEDKIMINLIIFEILFAEVLANHVRRT